MSLHLRGIIALFIVTLVWGTTFPAMKDLGAWFPPVWIIFLRFVCASVLLSPFLLRACWGDCKIGIVLGIFLFVCFVFQLEGLALISSNRNAFITGLNVLMVPLLGMLAGQRPDRRIVLAVLMAVAGLFALCWDGGVWTKGDTLTLMCALTFAVYVKLMEKTAPMVKRVMTLTVVQVSTVAVCAGLWLLLREVPLSRMGMSVDGHNYGSYIAEGIRFHFINLLYLGAIATAAIIALQTWGQHRVSANEAAVMYAFEPACAAIAAYFWVGESMTGWGIFGALLLIGGMIVSQWQGRPASGTVSPSASLSK